MSIDGGTRPLGLLGLGIRHSLSPKIQNHALERLGENLVYLPFEIDETVIPDFLRLFPRIGGVGLNVTTPFKSLVGGLVNPGDEEVQLTGVVNTIVFQHGKAMGRATDGLGFRSWMKSMSIEPGAGGILLLGFGAVARSLAYRLGTEYPVTVVTRAPAEVERTLQQWYARGWSGLPSRAIAWTDPPPARAVLAVSTLSPDIGRSRELAGWLAGLDPSGMLVDLNYGVGRTPLRDQARDRGLGAHDGLGLLVHQAALALGIWLGHPVSPTLLAEGLPPGMI